MSMYTCLFADDISPFHVIVLDVLYMYYTSLFLSLSLFLPLPPSLQIRSKNDKEKKRLMAVKEKIRKDLGIDPSSAGITQVDPAAITGQTEKSGYLAKKPENVLRLTRRQWPKRYCTVSKNGFTMAHSHVSVYMYITAMYIMYSTCAKVHCTCMYM